jgi:alkanesulfonate monooxygenase SsuD/methylene tetrahydromethanopterin reductase-like flavin-dependent oxidoreductase (luciferase family)
VVSAGGGQPVRYEGPEHRIRWRATYEPTSPTIPVLLSASGPKMVRLAGEVADGVGGRHHGLHQLSPRRRPAAARAAARQAGRNPDQLRFPVGAIVSINADPEAARQAAKATICGLFHPVPHPYYESQLRQCGFDDFADRAVELMPAGRTREAIDLVPEEVIDTMTVSGTVADCAARLAEYKGLADEVIVMRVGQRGEPAGLAAYEPLFDLARHRDR